MSIHAQHLKWKWFHFTIDFTVGFDSNKRTMSKNQSSSAWRSAGITLPILTLSLFLSSCGNSAIRSSNPVSTPTSSLPTSETFSSSALTNPAGMQDWRKESIYFVLADRFANGSSANDSGPNRNAGDISDTSNPLAWHGGDLAGIKQKIIDGYFKKMGFTALWISPVYLQVPAIVTGAGSPSQGKPFAGYHGYWAEDFMQVDPHLGTLQELKDVVQWAHFNGLKVVQDMVVNHAGYGSSLTQLHPDWFHPECINYSDVLCPLAGLPDFAQENPAVTQYLNQSVSFWRQNVGIDGIRMDTMKHVPDSYWSQFFGPLGVGQPTSIWTVGEVFNYSPSALNRFLQLGSPSVLDFPLYGAMRDSLAKNGSLNAVADVFAQDKSYSDASRLSTFVDNHDVRRFMSEGIESGISKANQLERLDAALSLIFTSRGTPVVYYGSEIGMEGKGDPYNYPTGQTNREDMNFTQASTSPLVPRIAALNAARKQYPALTLGAQNEIWRPNGGPNIYAFQRTLGGQAPVVVVVNGSDSAVNLATLSGGGIPLGLAWSGASLLEITGKTHGLSLQNNQLVGSIPARSTLAFSSSNTCATQIPVGDLSNVVAQPKDGEMLLKWNLSRDCQVTGYRVYRSVGLPGFPEKPTVLIGASLSANTSRFVVPKLTNGNVYTFRVAAINAWGQESTGITVKSSPTDHFGLTVHFKKPPTWNSANMYYWNPDADPPLAGVGWPGVPMNSEGTCTWYTYFLPNTLSSNLIFNNNGSPQTADLFRDKEGWFDGNTNTWSDTLPLETGPLAAPSSLKATPGLSSIALKWTVSSDCRTVGYRVYRAAKGSGSFTLLTPSPIANPSFSDTPAALLGGYTYKVVGVDASSQESAPITVDANLVSSVSDLVVYFKKPSSWSSANIHFWNVEASPAIAGSNWPGVAMTDTGNSWYKYTFPKASLANFLFVDPNNTNNKSSDLARNVSGWYWGDGWYNNQPTLNGITVYFKKPVTWNAPNIHYWNVQANPAINGTNWPGVAMTLHSSDWYKYTFTGATQASLLFNNNSSPQTSDFTRTGDGWYDGNAWTNDQP